MNSLGIPRGLKVSTGSRQNVRCKLFRPERSACLAGCKDDRALPIAMTRRSFRTSHKHRISAAAVASVETAEDEAGTIPAEELIQLTKDWVSTFNGVTEKQASKLSDEFVFRGPVVGPLTRDQYVYALNGFKFHEAFPDIETKAFGFSIDPQDPYRVWFFTQTTGTHTQPLTSAEGASMKPTGQPIRNGTEAASVIWTPDRKIKYASGGYCVDRINSNTPNGTMKVAGVGILRAAGTRIAWALFTNPIVQFIMNLLFRLRGKPKEARFGCANWEELPLWWRDLPDGHLRGPQRYYA